MQQACGRGLLGARLPGARLDTLKRVRGAGIHVCLGRPLARLEAGEALPALARRFPKMELAAEPVFNRNARFRGIQQMRVRLY